MPVALSTGTSSSSASGARRTRTRAINASNGGGPDSFRAEPARASRKTSSTVALTMVEPNCAA
jgi:hypothetical protein